MALEPVGPARERTIEELSRHFALDHLSLEELERRLEEAYRAAGPAELAQLTADLPSLTAAAAPVPARAPSRELITHDRGRILSLMSSTRRRGLWMPPRELQVKSLMAETVLDFTEAQLGPVTDVKLSAMWSSVHIIIPPGVQVIDQTLAVMANVRDDTLLAPVPRAGAPVIRIHGTVVMAELVIKAGAGGGS